MITTVVIIVPTNPKTLPLPKETKAVITMIHTAPRAFQNTFGKGDTGSSVEGSIASRIVECNAKIVYNWSQSIASVFGTQEKDTLN